MVELADIVADLIAAEQVAAGSVILRLADIDAFHRERQ
jgi:hypothetical protein